MILDSKHLEEENSFILLGMSDKMHLLVVRHCYRDDESVIRLISARHATHNEEIQYASKGDYL